ncbi:MAG: hypothetical protein ABJD66_05775 [Cellulophaga sp.]
MGSLLFPYKIHTTMENYFILLIVYTSALVYSTIIRPRLRKE